ncbi:ABC transporter ATP-binding protein [Rhodococcus sp. Eu-32]|uniref:ABC transporter ATP-binding protein n=1 Tax=Rhodococcus sp. Eu-32 TaxID=1017319 RepID=UPI000DF12B65|nr:ABC transporter ATP-binding protein [Rhodococcus sp. Eu-32]RRQ29454.1 ABC transporter ATP-binding protein [Rhodococcus sp. Eu-32]
MGSPLAARAADLGAADNPRIFRTGLSAMMRGSRGYPIATPVSILAGVVNGATMVLSAVAIGWATDHLILPAFDGQSPSAATWLLAVGFVSGVSLLRVTTIIVRSYAAAVVQFGNQATTRRDLVRQYTRLGVPWHRTHSTGQLLSNAVSDVDALWQPMQFFAFAMGSVSMLVFALMNIARSDLYLAVAAVALMAFVVAANVMYQRVTAPRARDAQRARADVSTVADESVRGEQVIRTLGIAQAETSRFRNASKALQHSNIRMADVNAVFDPVIELAPTATVLVVLVVGAARVDSGALTVGVLVEVIYLFLTMALPLSLIGRFLGLLPLGVVGHDRVRDVLDAAEYPTQGDAVLSTDGAIPVSIHGGSYSYESGCARPTLGPVDLDFSAGDVVAVVGATGSGKTTLLNVVARLADLDDGHVRYDGTNVGDLHGSETDRRVAIAQQTAFLFDASIRDNIAMGRDIDDDRIWWALKICAADEFVSAQADGLDERVGRAGRSLSGGQRQRIALARALVGRPSLIVLDDATSALDPTVEAAVLGNIRRELLTGQPGQRASTLVMSASRKTTVALAERVVLLDDGVIADVGTPDELNARSRRYRDIVDAYVDPL